MVQGVALVLAKSEVKLWSLALLVLILGHIYNLCNFSIFIYKMGVINSTYLIELQMKNSFICQQTTYLSTWNAIDHSINTNFQGSFVQVRRFKGEQLKNTLRSVI